MARALRELDINASHVGHDGDQAPARGSSDADVLSHAKKTNQVIVTSNHDMVLLCATEAESVIWIDPRGRQFRLPDMVALVFGRVEEWQGLLAEATEPVCLRVLRTKTEVLDLEQASHLVVQRMRRLQARKRSAAKRSANSGSNPSQPRLDES